MIDFTKPHRRFNPLTGDWILVSPHRSKRPWQGSIEQTATANAPVYDPTCYLCPGNTRASNEINPQYKTTFVFTNDHAALLPNVPEGKSAAHDFLVAQQERGTSRVVCYMPQHNKTMADMTVEEISQVITAWTHEYQTIGKEPFISYVQIFENKGPIMGASSPHPHSQIWANEHIPTIPAGEQDTQKKYLSTHSSQMLSDYLKKELLEGKRIVWENKSFVVLVPFWAIWPYETMILPKTHIRSLNEITKEIKHDLAQTLSVLTRRYDRLFNTSFPYSMGIHQAPTDGESHDEWQMHFHFYPPLLRSATVKKHYVGYEMMAEAQRDINPEEAANTLRELHE